jgi:hypothetical protein
MNIPHPKHYPKKIYFASECYKIKFLKSLKDYGETDSGKKEIRLKYGMSSRETFMTFLHELLHVIEFETPLKIKHKDIYMLEKAIFELLFDNF